MFVKICANTNLEDALTAAQLGADAVGFVFAPSKRQVTSEQVSEITRQLPKDLVKVGVFATDDPYEVEHYVACSGLNAAQLHGKFDAELVRLLSAEFGGELKIIQTVAFPVDPADAARGERKFEKELAAAMAAPEVWAVLLDAAKSGTSGGLGVAFDWKRAAEIVKRVTAKGHEKRMILAGGLMPESVSEAIATLAPFGVDVASGVEASYGRKDWQKLKAFLDAAHGSLVQRPEA